MAPVKYLGWRRTAAIAVGAVLFVAALAKIILPAAKSSVFGGVAHAAPWLAWLVIGIELVLATWLISGYRPGGAAAVALLLFSVFSGVIVHDMLQHHPQPCGCFGRAWQQAHEPTVIERHLAYGLGGEVILVAALGLALFSDGPAQPVSQTLNPSYEGPPGQPPPG